MSCRVVIKEAILTDKHNIQISYIVLLFYTTTCFGCLHLLSSGKHRFKNTIFKIIIPFFGIIFVFYKNFTQSFLGEVSLFVNRCKPMMADADS
jgi:hypothetical protein